MNQGNYGRAEEAFDRALALDPRSVKVRNLSGISAEKEFDPDRREGGMRGPGTP